MRSRALLSGVLLGLLACKPPASSDESLATGTSAELRVIVESRSAQDFYFQAKPATKFFTPTTAEVAAFETGLAAWLRANVPPSRREGQPLADRASKFMRQYVGHVEPDGSRWIWGNFFCRYEGQEPGGWRKRHYGVKDGGDCYFNLEFSPDSRAFKSLSINGEA